MWRVFPSQIMEVSESALVGDHYCLLQVLCTCSGGNLRGFSEHCVNGIVEQAISIPRVYPELVNYTMAIALPSVSAVVFFLVSFLGWVFLV